MKNQSESKPAIFLPYNRGQSSGKMRVEILRQCFGESSVASEPFKTVNTQEQGVQKVGKNKAEKVHQRFTKTSPDFEGLSLKSCRQGGGNMSAVLEPSFDKPPLALLPHIADYIRKHPFQFDIPSSYLYVVVLPRLPV